MLRTTENILVKITAHKRQEIAQRKAQMPASQLEHSPLFGRKCVRLQEWLTDRVGIIAEFKRRSPSKGIIREQADPVAIAAAYQAGGASAISILTDETFFGGFPEDLEAARRVVQCPLLRKDFVLDEYQLLEAKAWGADLVLLIAACLSPEQVRHLSQQANSLGLQVLLEVHDEQELQEAYCPGIDLVGVNNRDLRNFTVNVETSHRLAQFIPSSCLKVSESGLNNPQTVVELRRAGYDAFLIGEHFMREGTEDPGQACADFVRRVQELEAPARHV